MTLDDIAQALSGAANAALGPVNDAVKHGVTGDVYAFPDGNWQIRVGEPDKPYIAVAPLVAYADVAALLDAWAANEDRVLDALGLVGP